LGSWPSIPGRGRRPYLGAQKKNAAQHPRENIPIGLKGSKNRPRRVRKKEKKHRGNQSVRGRSIGRPSNYLGLGKGTVCEMQYAWTANAQPYGNASQQEQTYLFSQTRHGFIPKETLGKGGVGSKISPPFRVARERHRRRPYARGNPPASRRSSTVSERVNEATAKIKTGGDASTEKSTRRRGFAESYPEKRKQRTWSLGKKKGWSV